MLEKHFRGSIGFAALILTLIVAISNTESGTVASASSLPTFAQKTQRNGDGVLAAPAVKKDLYRANANPREEIAAALKSAARNHRRVMLVFGGNWCYDCHVLDRALHEGTAGRIMKMSFALVHVDIGEADKNLELAKQYKIPLDKGVPAVAILRSDGQMIYSSGEGEFEAARSMMKQDLVTFLQRWKAKRPAP
jgi:thiol:disulfide interchange protein